MLDISYTIDTGAKMTKLGQLPRNSRVYISGKIHGISNFTQIFEDAKSLIESVPGLYAVNPVDLRPVQHLGRPCPGGNAYYGKTSIEGHSSTCHMRVDIYALAECDAIYMLKGWESSVGARLELNIAATCAMSIIFEETN